MIRDPSDGTVRAVHQTTESASAPIGQASPESALPASGLPITRHKPEELERLQKSRAWLKDYHKPKERENEH